MEETQRAARPLQLHPAKAAIVDLFNLYLRRNSLQKSEDHQKNLVDLRNWTSARLCTHESSSLGGVGAHEQDLGARERYLGMHRLAWARDWLLT